MGNFLSFYLLILEKGRKGEKEEGRGRKREGEREKHGFVVPLIYAFISCLLYVPRPAIKPASLANRDNNHLSYLARAKKMFLMSLATNDRQ